jgi:hypothetical protein
MRRRRRHLAPMQSHRDGARRHKPDRGERVLFAIVALECLHAGLMQAANAFPPPAPLLSTSSTISSSSSSSSSSSPPPQSMLRAAPADLCPSNPRFVRSRPRFKGLGYKRHSARGWHLGLVPPQPCAGSLYRQCTASADLALLDTFLTYLGGTSPYRADEVPPPLIITAPSIPCLWRWASGTRCNLWEFSNSIFSTQAAPQCPCAFELVSGTLRCK